jgi:alanine racemase
VPVRGVSLEHTTIDLSGVGAKVGDEVVCLGSQGDETISAAEIASWQGATADDVVLAFDRKLARISVL